jgi:hypothetical protein
MTLGKKKSVGDFLCLAHNGWEEARTHRQVEFPLNAAAIRGMYH